MKAMASRPGDDIDDAERLYLRYEPLLRYIGEKKSRLSSDETTKLEQDVLLAYLQAGVHIHNIAGWMALAMCSACQFYLRKQAQEVHDFEIDLSRLPFSEVPDAVAVREAMNFLPPRARDILWLVYGREMPVADAAQEIGISAQHADRLVILSLRRLSEVSFALVQSRSTVGE
jgi:DNA-directed RNA polymerase specialized sigma24 family protein